jgi:hypothetical protein
MKDNNEQKEKVFICPLMSGMMVVPSPLGRPEVALNKVACMKEECAWWHDDGMDNKICCIYWKSVFTN